MPPLAVISVTGTGSTLLGSTWTEPPRAAWPFTTRVSLLPVVKSAPRRNVPLEPCTNCR